MFTAIEVVTKEFKFGAVPQARLCTMWERITRRVKTTRPFDQYRAALTSPRRTIFNNKSPPHPLERSVRKPSVPLKFRRASAAFGNAPGPRPAHSTLQKAKQIHAWWWWEGGYNSGIQHRVRVPPEEREEILGGVRVPP
jgi:hypothetical protein